MSSGKGDCALIRDTLVAKGTSATMLRTFRWLVSANFRGVDGHGVAHLSSYLTMIERGKIVRKRNRGSI